MPAKVLVVDDKPMMRDSVASILQRAGMVVVAAEDGQAALRAVELHNPGVILSDLKMPKMDGAQLLGALRDAGLQVPVVLMTAYGCVSNAVQAMKLGAFDFIQKPFDPKVLVKTIQRAIDSAVAVAAVEPSLTGFNSEQLEGMIGESPVMRQLKSQIVRMAQSDATILVTGESGAGKEVVARMIHQHSARAHAPMLCVNCAALSSSLLESELFGHEKGAFTGADQLRKGRFELADGGTLLLDEVSEIAPELQAKLLRVLQERQFERVGSSTTINTNVRVIATSNRDLAASVRAGDFRQDLFYRLNVLPLALPALREREGDVKLLADHFLKQFADRHGQPVKTFTTEAIERLERHTWPGNVRELHNVCERAHVLCMSDHIDISLVEPWLGVDVHIAPAPESAVVRNEPKPLEEVERDQIIRALDHFNGNRTRTAEALGIGVRTLGMKLRRWKENQLIAATI